MGFSSQLVLEPFPVWAQYEAVINPWELWAVMTDSVDVFVRGLCFYGPRWGFFIRWWELYFSQVIKLWHICLELRIILIFSWLFHYDWNNSQSCSCRTWSAQRNLSKPWKWIIRCTEKSVMRLLKLIPPPAPVRSFTGLCEKYFIPWHLLMADLL